MFIRMKHAEVILSHLLVLITYFLLLPIRIIDYWIDVGSENYLIKLNNNIVR